MDRIIRTYPPIIVSLSVAAALMIAAFKTISSNAEGLERRPERPPEKTWEAPAQAGTADTPEETGKPEETERPEPTCGGMVRSRDWDAEESEILLKVAMAEAEGESVEGKALVMLVVLNRVWSGDFPGTIEEVVFQPGQFSTVSEGGRYYTTEPDEGCYEALELVMGGWDESREALYFESGRNSGWHSRNLEFLYQEGNHNFYR